MTSTLTKFLFVLPLLYGCSAVLASAEGTAIYDSKWSCKNVESFDKIDTENGYALYRGKSNSEYMILSPFSVCPVVFKVRNPTGVVLSRFINEVVFDGQNPGMIAFDELVDSHCAGKSEFASKGFLEKSRGMEFWFSFNQDNARA